MIDTLIYTGLTKANLSTLLSDTDGFRVYPNGSLGAAGVPAEPATPYVQHGAQGDNRVRSTSDIRKTFTMYWDVFVYDEPGSYLRIKSILDLASDNLEGMVGQVTPDGWRATDIKYTNTGGDGYDTVKHLNTKRATFLVVTSRAV